jgi:murein DD-endopeptidase MepM/ murein hydrolase activator NlpD
MSAAPDPPRDRRTPQRPARLGFLASVLTLLVSACGPLTTLRSPLAPPFPHEQYGQSLRHSGLDRAAMGRDWLAAAESALQTTVTVTLPHRETGYFAPGEVQAVAYRFAARRGHRLRIDVEMEGNQLGHLFMDLFRLGPGSPLAIHISSAPADTRGLEFEVDQDGTYVLRLQPELLRGGRYTLVHQAHASLRFPLPSVASRAVISPFGAGRDAGTRAHHGVDIPAPRGTPVLSASDGIVSSVAATDVGGKVVWVSDSSRHISLYYAHLDTHAVSTGTRVRAGDVLGTVGNTGNARGTVPHLHFGIYHRRAGPVDPMPFVHQAPPAPVSSAMDTSAVHTWHRTDRPIISVSLSPATRSATVVQLPRHTVVRVQAALDGWYRVYLPDGRSGFVPAGSTRSAMVPLRHERRLVNTPIRDDPSPTGATLGYTDPEHPVPVLGRFGDYLLVRSATGRHGWLAGEPNES